jgi:hypothetical protein
MGNMAALKMHERQQEIADHAAAFYAPMRERFIACKVDSVLSTPRGILALVNQICDSSDDVRLGVALCDAIKESGHSWDGLTAAERLLRSVATRNAEQEWDETPRDFATDRAEARADFERTA